MTIFGKKISEFQIFGFLIFLSIFFSSCIKETEIPVKNGVADLRNTDIAEGKIYKLNGNWEFYYGKLLEPSDFSDTANLPEKEFIYVPKSWASQFSGKRYPAFGSATYRLKILANDSISQTILICKRIFSAYKIWFNGRLLYQAGKPAISVSEYEPDLDVMAPNPEYLKDENEIIIQVSNFSDRRAGILRNVSIGEVHHVLISRISELILIIAVLSIIFIISLYHLILFLYQRNDFSNLIFSILGLLFIIIGLTGNDTLLKNILNINYNTITRLFHLSASLYPALITAFFYLLYKNEVSKKFLYFIIPVSFALSILSLLVNISYIRVYVGVKILFLFIVSLYLLLYSLPKAILRKRQGAIWAYIGMLILVLTNINDVLFSLDFVKTGYLAIYGFFIYLIFQSMNIAERFSFSIRKNSKLTEDLKKRNKELHKAKIKAQNADKLKTAFLANMSHEIRTPMNAILGFSGLLADDGLKKEERRKLTSYIIKSGNTLLQLIDDIIDVSKIEAGQLEINKTDCYINHLFEELELIYSKKENLKSGETDIRFAQKYDFDLVLFTDGIRLKQVLINLINNALKFTEKGYIEITCEINENEKNVLFSVKDTGIGMSNEQKELIFKRFTKLENERQKLYRGAGLGLAISKNIIKLMGGKIWFESELGKGTTFYFTIPNIKR